jgi:signal transduction histidine kinase
MNPFSVKNTPHEFLAMVVHDLKSPISAEILALNQLLQVEDPDKRNELICDILGAASYMKNLVDNILGKYKLETGIMTLHKDDFCLKSLVNECINETKYMFDCKTVVFNCKVRDAKVNADYFEIKRVLHNLLVNACEHARKNTKIEIKLHKKRRNLVLSIKNYGHGIDNPDEIFNRNFTAGKRTGTGLGLYISKHIIEVHGGTISAESRGKWVKVAFTLAASLH